MSAWTVFSNHGHVLLFLARFPEARLRDVAEKVGITERAVQKIVKDLQDSQYISVHKHGRRNRYRINTRKPLRHELEAHKTIGNLIKLVHKESKEKSKSQAAKEVPPPAPANPVATQVPEQQQPPTVEQRSVASDFEGPGEYEQPDFEPDSELVPISAYDPFEEATESFEADAESDLEPEAPVASSQAPEKRQEQAVRQPTPPKAKDSEAKPGAKKTARKAKKDKPPDDQQGSLF